MPPADLDALAAHFHDRFGTPPTLLARVPGRVNLIGEHTDYSLLPVLPMAIQRSLLIAAAPHPSPQIEVFSTAFSPPADLLRSAPVAHAPWHRYLVAALGQLASLAPDRGARLLIEGDLPPAAGLSSSSALTVGVLAVLAALFDRPLDGDELVRRAVAAERQVAIDCGEMDQQVITFAHAGAALRIDFLPPARRCVPIPEGLALVAASSGQPSPKDSGARDAYNERVVGARLAAALLADQLGVDLESPPALGHLAGVDVVDLLVDELPPKISPREVAHGANLAVSALVNLSSGSLDPATKIPVRPIARHILSEARRVDLAEQALRAGDHARVGALLNESHTSLRDDFLCSTPALDRLTAAMRRAGAWGARLTGAGFGGFAVAVCPPDRLSTVLAAAEEATGGPAFEVHADSGIRLL